MAANVKIDGKILLKKGFDCDFIVKLYFKKFSYLGRASVGSYLSLPVHPDDARCGLMWCSDKDGLSTDAVHVDAGARLQVIEVNVPIFGNKENNIVFGAHLKKIDKHV